MNQPLDFFTVLHCLVGLVFGAFRLSRWLSYLPAIGWEVFQYYTYYTPQGLYLESIWLDSVIDLVVFAIGYELARKYLRVPSGLGFPALFALFTDGISRIANGRRRNVD